MTNLVINVPGEYISLGLVMQSALEQASKGKGRERHASEGEAYESQIICEVARRVGLGYPLGQAVKKIYESQRIGGERGVAELLGALNYVAAAVIVMREGLETAPKAEDEPEFKYGERVQFRDEIPSTSEPHWFDGVYVERLPDGGHAVKFGPRDHVIHCSDKEIRAAPKAEGCEEPEFEHGDAEGWVQLTFKAGDAVEWFSFGRKDAVADGWHPAFYLCRAGDRDYHVVQDIDGMYHVVNYANIRSPEAMYKPGDKVEALSFDGSRWEDAVVERTEVLSGQWHCTVRLASGERHLLPVAKSIRRPSKAEGCEALVEHDAPQTKEELFNRILSVNPATYGRARTPTGEELAEMAEEDAHE